MLKDESKGITLVALIITIILMLIIAGVAMSMLGTNDGLFTKTGEATSKYKAGLENENTVINDLINNMDKYSGQVQEENLEVEISTPYIGTSTCTIDINKNIEEDIKEYIIYLNGEEYGTSAEMPYTIENLNPETKYNVFIEVNDINDVRFKSNNQEIETRERVYLYKAGDECLEMTGGWKGVGVTDIKSSTGSSYSALVPNITRSQGYIYTSLTKSGQCTGGISTTNTIDLTPYKKLIVEVEARAKYGTWYKLLVTTDNTKYYNFLMMVGIAYCGSQNDTITVNRSIFPADISEINQNAYIAFNLCKSSDSTSYWVDGALYNAWLEY